MSHKHGLSRRFAGSTRQVRREGCPVTVEPLEQRTLMSAAPVLYADDGNGLLYTMNVTSGYTRSIGRMPTPMYDLAYSPSGALFGVDGHSNLYSINASTAATHLIGPTGAFLNGLTFNARGILYASGNNGIYAVSTTTGRATQIQSIGRNTSAGDLAFDKTGALYLTTDANYLVRINLSAHSYTVVGNLGFTQAYGMAYSNGVMYGFSNSSERVYTINTATGHGTATASFHTGSQVGIYGATFGTAAAPNKPSYPTIYTSDTWGDLYTYNVGTGQSHLIGYMGVTLFDLAEDPHGNLYGVDGTSNLYRVNPTTATATYVGHTGVFVNSLTFTHGGNLWATGNNGLYKISTSTGQATAYMTLGSHVSAGDITFDRAGTLFMTDTNDHLIRINVQGYSYTDVGPIGYDEVYGLVCAPDGNLYGLSNTSDQAFLINATSGYGTLVSSFYGQMHGVNGAAAVPV